MEDSKFGEQLQDLMQELDWNWLKEEKRLEIIRKIHTHTDDYLKKKEPNV